MLVTLGKYSILGLSMGLLVNTAELAAQDMSIPDRVTWAEAMLAYDEGATADALYLLEDVIAASGPNPAILYDAARAAFDLRDYVKAEDYIMSVLETDDALFMASEDYEEAFTLAARIQRTLRPLKDRLVNATPLPFEDSLSRPGFALARRDRNSECEWKFERGGLIGKYKKNATCMNGDASSTGRVRIQVTLEKRSGGSKSAAGIVFGHEDADNYFFVSVHPEWREAGGDMSLVGLKDGREVVSSTAFVYDARNRSLRDWSDDGPWQLAVEVQGRRIDWFLNDRHVGTEYATAEIRGDIMAAVAGADSGEFLFKDLSLERLSVGQGTVR